MLFGQFCHQQFVICNRLQAIGNRHQAIGNKQYTTGNKQLAIGIRQLVIRQTGVSRRTGELVAIKTYKLKSLKVYC